MDKDVQLDYLNNVKGKSLENFEIFSKNLNNFFRYSILSFAFFEGNQKIASMWAPVLSTGQFPTLDHICPCTWPNRAISTANSMLHHTAQKELKLAIYCRKRANCHKICPKVNELELTPESKEELEKERAKLSVTE